EVALVEQALQVNRYPVGGELGVVANAHHFLIVIGHGAAAGQNASIILAEAVLTDEAGALGVWQFGQLGANGVNVDVVDDDRQQIRLGEVAVVVSDFLAAHGTGLVAVGVVQAGFLDDAAAVLDDIDLALCFVQDRLLDKAERVDVLDLGAGAELGVALAAHRDVGVAAHRALRHVAVGNAQIKNDRMQLLEVGDCLLGAAQFRLGNDLQQRRAGAVEVDAGLTLEV